MPRSNRKIVMLLSAFGLVAACDGPATPTPAIQPSPPPQPAPAAVTYTVTGVVYEHTVQGPRPLAGAVVHWQEATTDADGRYTLPGLRSGDYATHYFFAQKAGYSQPCRVERTLAGDEVIDLHLVADAVLAASGIPRSLPVAEPTLSGVVFERTAEGSRPVAGAQLGLGFLGWGWDPHASYLTDSDGRYFICGVDPQPWPYTVQVLKPGYQEQQVHIDHAGTLNLELTRQ